jgi:FkbM family methyltransferase
VPFIGDSRFIVKRGRTGLTGNLYYGLHEFEDMAFILHFLRNSDTFIDIGSNVGSYSILATGVKCAQTISFEPVPSTFDLLSQNKSINPHKEKWRIENCGLGDSESTLFFSVDRDTMNSVVDSNYLGKKLPIKVITLDNYCKVNSISPTVLKIDAEGFDENVILGAKKIISDYNLKAIIIESNSDTVKKILEENNFKEYSYYPFTRELFINKSKEGNSLYIKDIKFVLDRVKGSPKINILGKSF